MGVALYEMASCELAFEDGTSAAFFDAIPNRAPKRNTSLNSEVPGPPSAG
jgi:hypothetical protein